MSRYPLLPLNSTKEEKGIASLSDRVSALEIARMKLLWDVDNCPIEWLEYMALRFNVEAWRLAQTEAEKRDLVKRNLIIKQKKGTPWATKEALRRVGITETALEEWFEYGGQPGMFRLIVDDPEKRLNAEEFEVLFTLIFAYKNARSHLEFLRFIRNRDMGMKVGLFCHRGITTQVPPSWDIPGSGMDVNAGAFLLRAKKTTIGCIFPGPEISGEIFTGMARMETETRITGEAI